MFDAMVNCPMTMLIAQQVHDIRYYQLNNQFQWGSIGQNPRKLDFDLESEKLVHFSNI